MTATFTNAAYLKYLGVLLDISLVWSSHVQSIKPKPHELLHTMILDVIFRLHTNLSIFSNFAISIDLN